MLVFTFELMDLAPNLSISLAVDGRCPEIAVTGRGCSGLAIRELGLNEPGSCQIIAADPKRGALLVQQHAWSRDGGRVGAG